MPITLGFFVYWLICNIVAALICTSGSGFLVEWGITPERCLSRGSMILALLGFWPLVRYLGLVHRAQLGFPNTGWQQAVGFGLLIGIVSLAPLPALLLAIGVRVPTPGVGFAVLPSAFGHGLLSGLLVALIEETCFRGILFTAVREHSGRWAAWIWPSVLYAMLHFFIPQPLAPNSALTFNILCQSVVAAFPALWHIENLAAFITLFLVGILLARLRERSGHIVWGIGIHAGWVLIIKITQVYTDVDYQASWLFLVSHYDGVIGWLGAAWVGLLILVLERRFKTL